MRVTRFFILASALLASSISAHAACSTATLAGSWTTIGQAATGYDLIVCSASLSTTGVISNVHCSNGQAFNGTLALTSACKITGKISGQSVRGRTNDSSAGPTMALVTSTNAAVAFTAYRN